MNLIIIIILRRTGLIIILINLLHYNRFFWKKSSNTCKWALGSKVTFKRLSATLILKVTSGSHRLVLLTLCPQLCVSKSNLSDISRVTLGRSPVFLLQDKNHEAQSAERRSRGDAPTVRLQELRAAHPLDVHFSWARNNARSRYRAGRGSEGGRAT